MNNQIAITDAFESLLSAINLSASLRYEYMEKLAKLHLAHIQVGLIGS